MTRLNLCLVVLALALAGCNTTTDSSQQAAAPSPLETLEPAAGDAKAEGEVAAAAQPAADEAGEGVSGTAAAPTATEPAVDAAAVDTSAVDQAAQAYLNCVVGRAAQSAEGGASRDDAVEAGVDACRNQFREARWAYKDTGVSDEAADRYGVNLLTFVRNEAAGFLDSPPS